MPHFQKEKYKVPTPVKRSSVSALPHRRVDTDKLARDMDERVMKQRRSPVMAQGTTGKSKTTQPRPIVEDQFTQEFEPVEEPARPGFLVSVFLFVTYPVRYLLMAFWAGFTFILVWSWNKGHLPKIIAYMAGMTVLVVFFGHTAYLVWNQGIHEYRASQGMVNVQVLNWGQGDEEVLSGVDSKGHGYVIVIKEDATHQLQAPKIYLLPEKYAPRTWVEVKVESITPGRKALVVQPFGYGFHGLIPQADGSLLWDRQN